MNDTTCIARKSLLVKMSDVYNVEPAKLMSALKATAFRLADKRLANGSWAKQEVSDEQMIALLIVADQYGLNPFTKEIYAYPDKGGIVPVVSVDGWLRIINTHPAMESISFAYSEEMVQIPGAKRCHEWVEVTIKRKDRPNAIPVREYLDEVYVEPRDPQKPGPWQTHTKRMLRHKALIQSARVVLSFAGIFDEDEAGRIVDSPSDIAKVVVKEGGVAGIKAALGVQEADVLEPSEVVVTGHAA